jgi:hypothetical protein
MVGAGIRLANGQMVSKNTGVSMAMNTQDHETVVNQNGDRLYGVASTNTVFWSVQTQAIFASKPQLNLATILDFTTRKASSELFAKGTKTGLMLALSRISLGSSSVIVVVGWPIDISFDCRKFPTITTRL